MGGRIILTPDSDLFQALDRTATERRCVFVSGLSGVGKSLIVQQLSFIALQRGRSVHLLQWDAARAPFDRPDILALYPEIDGVTHAAIRKAVGLWARKAISEWERNHPEPGHMLIGEAPLIGGRLIELAREQADDLEPLLSGDLTVFMIPAPSLEVREAIVASRRREMDAPSNEREALSALPSLLASHWLEIDKVAGQLGVAKSSAGYDAEVYVSVYRQVLRHRECQVLPILTVLPVSTSAHELDVITSELIPTPDAVDRAMAQVTDYSQLRLEQESENWFRT